MTCRHSKRHLLHIIVIHLHALCVYAYVQICTWDESKGWISDFVTDCEQSSDPKRLSFRLHRVPAVVSLVQTSSDVPYKDWSIRPLPRPSDNVHLTPSASTTKSDIVLFSIQTRRMHLDVHIVDDSCILVKPPICQMQHLLGKALSSPELLVALRHCGINLMPTDQTGTLCNLHRKDKQLVERFCEDMGLLCTGFVVQASHFNSSLGRSIGMYQIKEWDGISDENSCFPMHLLRMEVLTPKECGMNEDTQVDRCSLLPGRRNEERSHCDTTNRDLISSVLASASTTSSSLSAYFCLREVSSKVAIEKVSHTSSVTAETVKAVIHRTGVLSFCSALPE